MITFPFFRALLHFLRGDFYTPHMTQESSRASHLALLKKYLAALEEFDLNSTLDMKTKAVNRDLGDIDRILHAQADPTELARDMQLLGNMCMLFEDRLDDNGTGHSPFAEARQGLEPRVHALTLQAELFQQMVRQGDKQSPHCLCQKIMNELDQSLREKGF